MSSPSPPTCLQIARATEIDAVVAAGAADLQLLRIAGGIEALLEDATLVAVPWYQDCHATTKPPSGRPCTTGSSWSPVVVTLDAELLAQCHAALVVALAVDAVAAAVLGGGKPGDDN